MNQKLRSFLCALPALAGSTSAQIDSGGGKAAVGRLPIPTVAGRIYKVWATRDLASWHLRQTLTGDGSVQNFRFDESSITSGPLHTPGQSARCFFRVEVSLP